MYRCQFIPHRVLERLAGACGDRLAAAGHRAGLSEDLSAMRATPADGTAACDPPPLPGEIPEVTVFDCRQTLALPGVPVAQPQASSDATVRRAHARTVQFACFLRRVFQRHSLDHAGMALRSSVHYGVHTNNAMWNGQQMVYGDGDGALFVDMTLGSDVSGHEWAHGMVQHALRRDRGAAPGWLDETLADCFGAMFAQWGDACTGAGPTWRIGQEVLGPALRARGYTCVRDMADPAASHCLAPQPAHFRDLTPAMDAHAASGPPNRAFCTACQRVAGPSWTTIGQVWYRVMTGPDLPARLPMAGFAARSRQAAAALFGADGAVADAVDQGWKNVGL